MSFYSFAPKVPHVAITFSRFSRAFHTQLRLFDSSQRVSIHFSHHAADRQGEQQTPGTHGERAINKCARAQRQQRDVDQTEQVKKLTGPKMLSIQPRTTMTAGERDPDPTINAAPKAPQDFHIYHTWCSLQFTPPPPMPCTRETPGPARARLGTDTEMPHQLFLPSLLKQSAPSPG